LLRALPRSSSATITFPRYRFQAEIISHAVWLYHVFCLSLRDVELILAERGVIATHESIRLWCTKFGAEFARRLCKRRPRPGDVCTWMRCSSEFAVFCIIFGAQWDQHGVVLDILVQERRNGPVAKRH
jgi:putative transposase